VITTVRTRAITRETRSRVCRRRERWPSCGTYCLGRSAPTVWRTNGRRRRPSPPGPALWPSCLGFAQGPGPCDLSSSRRLSHVAEQAVGRATTVEANPPAVCIRVRAFEKQLPKVHRWATRRSLRCVSITPSPTADPCRRRSYLPLFANRERLACPNLRGRLLPAPRSPQKLEASEPSFGKCIVGFDRWVCEKAEPKGTSGRTGESAAATSKARTQTASGDAGSGDALPKPPRDPAQVWPPAMAQNICCRGDQNVMSTRTTGRITSWDAGKATVPTVSARVT
jgi:hypothetical protein